MNVGPHTTDSSLNLVEQIAFYSALIMLHGQQEADKFLMSEVPADFHSAIKACVNGRGVVINSRGGEFFLEHYTGPLLPEPKESQQW